MCILFLQQALLNYYYSFLPDTQRIKSSLTLQLISLKSSRPSGRASEQKHFPPDTLSNDDVATTTLWFDHEIIQDIHAFRRRALGQPGVGTFAEECEDGVEEFESCQILAETGCWLSGSLVFGILPHPALINQGSWGRFRKAHDRKGVRTSGRASEWHEILFHLGSHVGPTIRNESSERDKYFSFAFRLVA